jgi:two-component system chemotaxis response regulator CheV
MLSHDKQAQLYEDYLDEDEIDLVKLVSSSADIASKYIVFEGSNAEYYAINVAKVEELFVYDASNIVRNNSQETLIIGTADIRSNMTPLIYFDEWFGNKNFENTEYELLIFCHFSSEYLGIVVKQVLDIISISPQQMHSSAKQNELTTFIAKVAIGKKTLMCTIFDTDKLLYDLYGEEAPLCDSRFVPIKSDKLVLFADDSRLVRKMALETFEKLGVRFQIFEDGQALLDALETIQSADIGLFLLDIEMPRKTGIDVIDALKQESVYDAIPIVVHTNMANASITESLKRKNVSKIIAKVDFATIEAAMKEYLL